jgi:small nuclear ribonucleoprotein B and B'
MAYDRHMNLVLGDAEEFRKLPPKKGKSEEEVRVPRGRASALGAAGRGPGPPTAPSRARPFCAAPSSRRPRPAHLLPALQREERRVLGLVLLRGEEVVSLTIEGPPPQEDLRAGKSQAAPPGTGAGRAAGRGVPVAAPGQAPAVGGGQGGGGRGLGLSTGGLQWTVVGDAAVRRLRAAPLRPAPLPLTALPPLDLCSSPPGPCGPRARRRRPRAGPDDAAAADGGAADDAAAAGHAAAGHAPRDAGR